MRSEGITLDQFSCLARCSWAAMLPPDPATARSRGWVTLRRRASGSAVFFRFSRASLSWPEVSRLLPVTAAQPRRQVRVTSMPSARSRASSAAAGTVPAGAWNQPAGSAVLTSSRTLSTVNIPPMSM